MIGLDKMHTDGFHGEGIDVAIFDGPFNGMTHCPPSKQFIRRIG